METRPTSTAPKGNCPFCCASMEGEDRETCTPVRLSDTGFAWWHNHCRAEFLIWQEREEWEAKKDERLAREYEERKLSEAAAAKADKVRRRYKLVRRVRKLFEYI